MDNFLVGLVLDSDLTAFHFDQVMKVPWKGWYPSVGAPLFGLPPPFSPTRWRTARCTMGADSEIFSERPAFGFDLTDGLY